VIPDRIEAGTFAIAAAMTGGRVTLSGAPCDHLGAFIEAVGRAGVSLSCGTDTIEVDGRSLDQGGYRACDIETAPYPGLATDLQPPTSVLLTQADGVSHVHETIFEDRLEWLTELNRMGAKAELLDGHHATITGRTPLRGAEVEIGDLRAGASLMLAAVAAEGTTTIHGAHHVHRGYENIDRKFLDLGARIERLAEGTDSTSS
jgi:UDP-N-acetylglucosamine 1-carboxyvinyltransferase